MRNSIDIHYSINSHTKLYSIFGNPVRHSLSPIMQNAAFRSSGINAVYLAFELQNIKEAISSMKALNIYGASVTIPFKREAIKYLDEIDPLAHQIGSVNTLKNANGKIIGYNTDGYGALSSLTQNSVEIQGSNVLILGNGGSARAIAFALLNEDANITIAGRNVNRILTLINDLREMSTNVEYTLIKDISVELAKGIDVIINTTPVGMKPNIDSLPIDKNLILKEHTVFDIVYSPNTTKLLQIGKSKGCRTIHGIEMLVHQGAKQFEIWTGLKAPFDDMKRSIEKCI